MSDPALQPATDLITEFEGYREHAYWDSHGKVWTVGYGWTHGVSKGDTLAEDEALKLVTGECLNILGFLGRVVQVKLNSNQRAALCSFIYNLGETQFLRSTLLRRLNANDHAGAADELLRWTKAGGAELRGLVRRRERERALFLTPTATHAPGGSGLWASLRDWFLRAFS